MGDLQAASLRVDLVAMELNPPPLETPDPAAIEPGSWRRTEEATRDIIERIQPTLISEDRRRAVIEYVQKLIRGYIGFEVFPFGSVPLKTYLPDGDIDLTALGLPNSDDNLAADVRFVLESEEKNKDAEFEVKDVQYIHAEVKLVKCLVQNIVVDISFNQIGGLCTLCFLEQVDRLIGKNNLFKRSIILIKAWCYYESRILGAHHGLISTYALETLVLYIFHLFHSFLEGPLAVLYRFLEYYSKFDWDNYCISLNGPIPVSSLPELAAEAPENGGGELLLSKDFLKNSADMFSVPPRGLENSPRVFIQKHLNIVDPLRENNNLGRSVSKGNFYRIRSAFTYGARKLGRILLLPPENIADEISAFFANTMERHGSGERPDVQDEFTCHRHGAAAEDDKIGAMSCELRVQKGREDGPILQSPTADSNGTLSKEVSNFKSLDFDESSEFQVAECSSTDHIPPSCLQTCIKAEADGLMEENTISRNRLRGDARDLATSRVIDSKTASETPKALPSNSETCTSPSGKACYAPHHFFQPDKCVGNGLLDQTNPAKLSMEKYPTTGFGQREEIAHPVLQDSYETESLSNSSSWICSNHGVSLSTGYNGESISSSWNSYPLENSYCGDMSLGRSGGNSTRKSPKSHLVKLTGDYETHFRSLLYAQSCHEYTLGGIFYPNPRSSPPPYRNKHSWDAFRSQGMFMHINANGLVHGPPIPPGCFPLSPPLIAGTYGEEMPKPRGTGTYFPNTNYRTYKERHSPGRGRGSANHLPRVRNNGRPVTPPDMNFEKGSHDSPLQSPHSPSTRNGRGKPPSLEIPQAFRPSLKGVSHANSLVFPLENRLEFGTFGPVTVGGSLSEAGRRSDSANPHSWGSASPSNSSTIQRPGTSSNSQRVRQSYQLKDEEDFPPLSG